MQCSKGDAYRHGCPVPGSYEKLRKCGCPRCYACEGEGCDLCHGTGVRCTKRIRSDRGVSWVPGLMYRKGQRYALVCKIDMEQS